LNIEGHTMHETRKVNRKKQLQLRCAVLLFCGLFFVLAFCLECASTRSVKTGLDKAWWAALQTKIGEESCYKGIDKTSRYLEMHDGVRIAVDLYLPKNLRKGEKLPTILMQTRYFRSFHFYWPTSAIIGIHKEIKRIVEHGYALVRTDVRGTGASFGIQSNPWSLEAIHDGAEIVDWIIAQQWSNGKVGSVGGSYEGTTAEFLLINRHPAVKAVAPLFSLYDVYTDVGFPGGIQLEWFTRIWEKGNLAMDTNKLRTVAWYAPLFTRGVMPVDGDKRRRLLKQAVAEHAANFHVHEEALQITFRDDESKNGFTVDKFSPHTFQAEISESGAAIYNYSGWFDGGYQHSAIKRFLTLKGPKNKLTIGPWDHGGDDFIRQFEKPRKADFDHVDEMMRFFDYHLLGIETGIYNEPSVHYYTMGEDRWKTSNTWPPESAKPTLFYFGGGGSLVADPPVLNDQDEYRVDLTIGTGKKTRWNCLAEDLAVTYSDRKEKDEKLLIYQTAPLSSDMEVTGHPIVDIYVSSTASDGEFFVYLEDVNEKGQVGYVTEGMLRALHQKISDEKPPYESPTPYHTYMKKDAMPLAPGEVAELNFDLLPVSYLYKKGHQIRIAVAGADADLFKVLQGDPPLIHLQRSAKYPSHIILPVIGRSN